MALPTAEVGCGSAFRALLVGVPRDLENVEIHFGSPGTALHCEALPGGDWRAYASGLYFPDETRTQYHVTARTPQGNSLWLGSGVLFVRPAPANTDAASAPIVPDDTYVRNPETGKWHKLTVSFEGGLLVPDIEPNGVDR